VGWGAGLGLGLGKPGQARRTGCAAAGRRPSTSPCQVRGIQAWQAHFSQLWLSGLLPQQERDLLPSRRSLCGCELPVAQYRRVPCNNGRRRRLLLPWLAHWCWCWCWCWCSVLVMLVHNSRCSGRWLLWFLCRSSVTRGLAGDALSVCPLCLLVHKIPPIHQAASCFVGSMTPQHQILLRMHSSFLASWWSPPVYCVSSSNLLFVHTYVFYQDSLSS
jgi:hypothetical protein